MENMRVRYITRCGKSQWKPVLKSVMAEYGSDLDTTGWCLYCGDVVEGVEPDARKYECCGCGQRKVYGFAELALMGLLVLT